MYAICVFVCELGAGCKLTPWLQSKSMQSKQEMATMVGVEAKTQMRCHRASYKGRENLSILHQLCISKSLALSSSNFLKCIVEMKTVKSKNNLFSHQPDNILYAYLQGISVSGSIQRAMQWRSGDRCHLTAPSCVSFARCLPGSAASFLDPEASNPSPSPRCGCERLSFFLRGPEPATCPQRATSSGPHTHSPFGHLRNLPFHPLRGFVYRSAVTPLLSSHVSISF